MDENKEIEIYDELECQLHELEEIYKLTNFMKKYCDSNKDSDDLYEISSVVDIMTEKLNQVSLNLYRLMHKNDIPPILRDLNKRKSE